MFVHFSDHPGCVCKGLYDPHLLPVSLARWLTTQGQLDCSGAAATLLESMDSILSLSPHQLRRAADVQERVASLQKELSQILGTSIQVGTAQTAAPAPGKRRMSPAGRARIAAAARAMWLRRKAQKSSVPATRKIKRTVSPAAKARLAAIARARWKKARAAGKSTL
jgi:hypothetical protein